MKTLTSSRNIVGGNSDPKDLYSYGDRDGVSYAAKLQHPLGVHFIPEKNVLLVADTFNHKIKVVDPFKSESFSWLGGSKDRFLDGMTGQCALNEPQGISSLFDETTQDVKIFICDTNNHCIRSCHYDVGKLKTLTFKGVPKV